MTAAQLSFLPDPALDQLRAENTWLRERLANAKGVFRQQRDDLDAAKQDAAHWYSRCLALRAELKGAGGMASDERRQLQRTIQEREQTIRTLESQLRLAQSIAALYRTIAAEKPWSPTNSQPVLTRETLTQLLTLAHPDKWSQGQPATELAHELAVAINRLRDHTEVLP